MLELSRTDLSRKYGINKNTWERRKDELVEYLSEFMEITEVKTDTGRFIYQVEGELPDSIPPIPRKSQKSEKDMDYYNFTIAALGVEFKPNSKSRIAKDAISSFGFEKYNHESIAAVVRRYVGPVVDENGEHTQDMVWVHSDDYEPLNNEEQEYLMSLFNESDLRIKEMAEAFIKVMQGQSIQAETDKYNYIMLLFYQKYKSRPIKVYKWRLKVDFDKK